MRNLLAKLLLILGVIAISVAIGLNFYSKSIERKAKNDFENKLENVDKVNSKEKEDSKIENQIALIDIPSINLSSIIVEGIREENIKYYVGHFPETAMPGEKGNFCIAGHSSNLYSEVFNNLEDIKESDEINIKTLDGKYTYIVKEKFITEDTNLDVLNQDYDSSEITIVTCTKDGKKRVIVKGNLAHGGI